MALLVLHQTPLHCFLHQDLVTKHINSVLLALCMIVEVVLNFTRKHRARKIVRLQSIHQIHDFYIVELVVAALREVDKLLTLLRRELGLPLILALELGPLIRVKHGEELLDLVRIIRGLNELLGLQVKYIKLFTLVENALFHLLPHHLLEHELLV